MRLSRARGLQILPVLFLLGIVCLVVPLVVVEADSQPQTGQCSGYYYTVKLGETWSSIARRVGEPVSVLKSANPGAVRPRDLIYAGEKLCIPGQGGAVEQSGYWYQVKPGDTWNKISRATGISVQQLWEANPRLLNRRQWLYIGQRIWVPAPAKSPTLATPTPTEAPRSQPVASPAGPTPTQVPAATSTPTALPTAAAPVLSPATNTPTAVPPVGPAATPARTAVPSSSPEPVEPAPTLPPIPADCPRDLAGYAGAVAAHLNKAGNTPATLETWLIACRAGSPDVRGVTVAPITAQTANDVIVVLHDPAAKIATPRGQLLVYHKGSKGYALAHKHEGEGRVELVQAADVNADGKFDIVYSDTSCGAHTCFGTLSVVSWDGKAYGDWITDSPTIAHPEYTVKDVATEGQGNEILVHGGVIGSVGAGPQRPWTETYISPKGAPYVLFSQVYDPSTCLYHKITDANQAFDQWALDGFEPAIEAYKAAVADRAATACGTIKDEVATLRDFARFRLIVAYIAAGRATEGVSLPAQITNTALQGAATTFLNSYKDNGSVIQACRDTNKYAEANSASWQFLADWGYANPSFTAGDLCPLN